MGSEKAGAVQSKELTITPAPGTQCPADIRARKSTINNFSHGPGLQESYFYNWIASFPIKVQKERISEEPPRGPGSRGTR